MPQSNRPKVQPISEPRQKGNPDSRAQKDATAAQKPATSVHHVEPEDKKGTGTPGAQQSKVLQMNVGENGHAQQHPATPAGQHATGSFPSGNEEKSSKRTTPSG
jgi:hypothetical protein